MTIITFYARIQHKLSGDDTQSSVKNVFYTLQADYSAYNAKLENPNHGKTTLTMVMLESLHPQSMTRHLLMLHLFSGTPMTFMFWMQMETKFPS